MRYSIRRTGLVVVAGGVILCCSCERHHVGELPTHEAEVKAGEGKAHKRGGHVKGKPAKNVTPVVAQPNDSGVEPHTTPMPSPTAVNFFPSPSPH